MSAAPGAELAFVVQRYGTDITGGSESLARAVAERLSADFRITVFTTCARDYVTWRNELSPGTTRSAGLTVRRFEVEEERDLESFNRFSDSIYDRPHTDEDERRWLRRQGPYVPELVRALAAEHQRFQAVLFFTYLYYPTCEGLRAAPSRSILVPTAHDEPPLRLRLFADVFARPRAFAFLTATEEALVRGRFPLGERPALVAGMGVEEPGEPDVTAFRDRYGLEGPYLVYAGRIDAGKGCAEMVAFYERFRGTQGRKADLLLLGRLAMALPALQGLRYLGHVPEEDKRAALAGAEVVLCPSPYESLSLALLEAFALGTPALANGRSAVLQEHCRRANAGLFYENEDEFVEALGVLLGDKELRQAMGENGRRYVHENYRWPPVLDRYRRLIAAVS